MKTYVDLLNEVIALKTIDELKTFVKRHKGKTLDFLDFGVVDWVKAAFYEEDFGKQQDILLCAIKDDWQRNEDDLYLLQKGLKQVVADWEALLLDFNQGPKDPFVVYFPSFGKSKGEGIKIASTDLINELGKIIGNANCHNPDLDFKENVEIIREGLNKIRIVNMPGLNLLLKTKDLF